MPMASRHESGILERAQCCALLSAVDPRYAPAMPPSSPPTGAVIGASGPPIAAPATAPASAPAPMAGNEPIAGTTLRATPRPKAPSVLVSSGGLVPPDLASCSNGSVLSLFGDGRGRPPVASCSNGSGFAGAAGSPAIRALALRPV